MKTNSFRSPPINPAARNPEHHAFLPAFILALLGGLVIVCGARHVTRVDTVSGRSAWETELVKAFSSGGLQFPDQLAASEPPRPPDPDATNEELDRWARRQAQHRSAPPPNWKVRVDLDAKTPCPT